MGGNNIINIMNYTEVVFFTSDAALLDILVSELVSIGFEGFEEEVNLLKAFASGNELNPTEIEAIASKYGLEYAINSIPQQNWNALWESNFSPIVMESFVGIRAHFHEPIVGVEHEITITPKMSFGTGHHATTYMVMQLMQNIDFQNKSVLDFGTGTGILAILAEKLGSTELYAIDNDDWCIENAIENAKNNDCKYIKIEKATTAITPKQYDIVLANINKNIILENIEALTNDVVANGLIILSGLLVEDEKDILVATKERNWLHLKTVVRNNWIAMQFSI